ncbi:MAG: sulfatase [Actinomycetota bacterium]|nr:sulfatase [Actinomycetota bacterium]
MSFMKRHWISALVALSLLSTAAQLRTPAQVPTSANIDAPTRPNVLIIVTDDQRDGLGVMPATRRWLVRGGTKFTKGFVTTPVCCPSRASIFTGRYTHNHHVFSNDGEGGNLIQQTTLQYYLKQAGYETGLFGKYLNGWDIAQAPPYFDQYAMTKTNAYHNHTWNVNGTLKPISDYNTVYLSHKVHHFLHGAGAQQSPWFLYLATAAPHSPFTPQRKYAHAPVSTWKGDPAVFEKDRSDKPSFVQKRHGGLAYGQSTREKQFRTLMSVDDLVSKVFTNLRNLGEDKNTLVFLISDNGLMWGEHGLKHKKVPYDQSIHVPFLVRWPGHFLAHATDSRIVANIDIAPTVLEATGVTSNPAYPIDGRSLLGATSHRESLLTEQFAGQVAPSGSKWENWASIRTKYYEYTEYYQSDGTTVKFREYYDLSSDPWELRNLLGDLDPFNDPDVASLSQQLAHDRACEGTVGPTACP